MAIEIREQCESAEEYRSTDTERNICEFPGLDFLNWFRKIQWTMDVVILYSCPRIVAQNTYLSSCNCTGAFIGFVTSRHPKIVILSLVTGIPKRLLLMSSGNELIGIGALENSHQKIKPSWLLGPDSRMSRLTTKLYKFHLVSHLLMWWSFGIGKTAREEDADPIYLNRDLRNPIFLHEV